MLIQWLVLMDKGWQEVGDALTHQAFTEAYKEREAQLFISTDLPVFYN